MEQDVIKALKAQNPGAKLRLLAIDAEDDKVLEFVVVAPSQKTWKDSKRLASSGLDEQSVETICYDCLKYPSKQEAAKLFEEFPILQDKLSAKILELGMASATFTVEKL